MALTITSEDVLFGPPSSLKFGGVELGASEDPAKLMITVDRYSPGPFQGAGGDIVGLTRINKITAKLAVKLNELSLAKLQWALQNVTTTIGTAATTSPGLATTLTADAAAGATALALTASTNAATGVFLKVGDVGETEIVQVGTYVSGLTVNLTTPLVRAHDVGDAVVMVDDAGTTIIRQRTGMVAASEYKDVVMQAIGPDGLPTVVTLFDCLNTASVEMTFGEATSAGTPIEFEAYYAGADPTLAPYAIERLT